jgi:dynein heavy chain
MKWPEEALIEVAEKALDKMDVDDQWKPALAQLCGYAFSVAQEYRDKMEKELKRVFYVTPTNFIELNKGYSKILEQKKKEIGNQRNKLRSGLSRLEEAGQEVTEMTVQSDIKRQEVTKKTTECENLQIEMTKRQAAADEKQKIILAETEKVNVEKENTEYLAQQAESELKRALPALEAANEAIDMLDKKSVSEVRAYTSPPKEIQTVMSAVMICLGKATDWPSVKKEMTDPKFMEKIQKFDKDHIPDKVMSRIESYTKKDNFLPQLMKKKSEVAAALCLWVRSIEEYNKALKIVIPKRRKKEAAEAQLAKLMKSL